MTKIGLMSDSHGNLGYLKKAADYLSKEARVDFLIHLGDNYEDAELLKNYKIKLIQVPGVFSPLYQDPDVSHRIMTNIEGLRIMISHTVSFHQNDSKDDLLPEEAIKKGWVDMLLYGHTHIYSIDFDQGVILINPGHLKAENDKGNPPTFSEIEIGDEEIKVRIIGLNYEIILEEEFSKNPAKDKRKR
ncbi:YfcE family phosphodiesterase [bacterium]|nr:YfcE family phosphodiesterase [bacterium]